MEVSISLSLQEFPQQQAVHFISPLLKAEACEKLKTDKAETQTNFISSWVQRPLLINPSITRQQNANQSILKATCLDLL